jgi:hypothetical protein
MDRPDQDLDIFQVINSLSEEEERLWASASDGRGLDPDERRRLEDIKVALDKAYDLLHQRAALRSAGRDPSEASERSADIVERYQQ